MKVLLINHFPLQGSGSGIYTLNIAKELQNQGHEVFVIDIDNKLDSTDYGFERKTMLCNKFENPSADLDFNFPCFTTHPRSLQTFYQLDEKQIDEYVTTLTRITKTVCKKFKPDVIHAQHLWITPYIAFKCKKPYIVTAHGTDLMGFPQDNRYHCYALTGTNNAGGIITISNQVHQDALDLYKMDESRLQLIPNGFDQNIFKVKDIDRTNVMESFGIKTNYKKIISFVGKFTDFKGIDTLLNAAIKISEHFDNIAFLLAGDGELMQDMKALVTANNLDNVYFLKHQSQTAVSDLYNLADLSIVPSRIEPFGLVAIEALACGTPVIATNAGGLSDFINDDVGRLVEMDNPDMLADTIIEELENDCKRVKGKYVAEYAENNYSWSHTIASVIDLYKRAIK